MLGQKESQSIHFSNPQVRSKRTSCPIMTEDVLNTVYKTVLSLASTSDDSISGPTHGQSHGNLSEASPTSSYSDYSATTTHTTHSTPGYISTTSDMDILEKRYEYFAAPSILLSIMTITLNIFVIRFYRKTELTVVPLLYTFIAVMDILCAIGTIYQFITLEIYFELKLIRNEAFDINAMIFLFLMQVGYRCSVFCNLVLAVSRTIMILNPFHHIKIKAVKVVCILYAVPWTILFVITAFSYCEKYFHMENFSYFEYVLNHEWHFGVGLSKFVYSYISKSEPVVYVIRILPELVAFVLPVIIIIITCIVQMISIWKASQFTTSSNQRHVTITVLLMSTLFVVCNTPFSVHVSYYQFTNKMSDAFREHALLIFATILPLLNGALNPVIIISRSSEMRRKFSESFQKMKCYGGGGQREVKRSSGTVMPKTEIRDLEEQS